MSGRFPSERMDDLSGIGIGDSILNRELVRNDEHLIDIGRKSGYSIEANFTRNIQESKKSFNPVIGKIRQEHIVILKNSGATNASP